jgi:acyl-CoA dehydrogenase
MPGNPPEKPYPGLATSIFDNSLGMEPVILSRNEEVKKKYLPIIANEFKLICFATSEPMTGSDVSGIRCKAKQDGEEAPEHCPYCFFPASAFKRI